MTATRRKIATTRWNAADYLGTPELRAAYLEAALEDGDPQVIAAATGDITRALGMANVAERAGLGRESLYKALSHNGNPELATFLRVIAAIGLKLQAIPVEVAPSRRRGTRATR